MVILSIWETSSANFSTDITCLSSLLCFLSWPIKTNFFLCIVFLSSFIISLLDVSISLEMLFIAGEPPETFSQRLKNVKPNVKSLLLSWNLTRSLLSLSLFIHKYSHNFFALIPNWCLQIYNPKVTFCRSGILSSLHENCSLSSFLLLLFVLLFTIIMSESLNFILFSVTLYFLPLYMNFIVMTFPFSDSPSALFQYQSSIMWLK